MEALTGLKYKMVQGHSYESVFFINKDTGWITRTGNTILKTTNGGLSFDSAFAEGRLYDIYFKNSNEGLACGQSASMRRTTNGGLSWSEISVPVGTKADDLYRLTFVNQYTGYTQGVHNSKIYKTTDFGDTWDSLTRIPGTTFMNCIFFSSTNTGWSCGDNNQIFKTTDTGLTWQQENTSHFNPWAYGAIYFIDDSIGWAVGSAGKIIHTTNGGLTFVDYHYLPLVNDFSLEQNYPNPFNSSTKIKYNIFENEKYRMEIFNSLGQIIELLFDEYKIQGSYEFLYECNGMPSGIYFYRLSGKDQSQLNKFLLIK